MSTITLPVASVRGITQEVFEIDGLSFARSITRQGKGARAAWRHHLGQLRFPVIESDEVREWNEHRDQVRDWTPDYDDPRPLHGIRAEARRRAAEQQRIDDAWRPIEEQSAPGADD